MKRTTLEDLNQVSQNFNDNMKNIFKIVILILVLLLVLFIINMSDFADGVINDAVNRKSEKVDYIDTIFIEIDKTKKSDSYELDSTIKDFNKK